MKVMIPGGHLTPALAVADALVQLDPATEIVFVGRVYSQDTLKQKSQEAEVIAGRGWQFKTFWAPRWSKVLSWQAIVLWPGQFGWSVGRALVLMIWCRPTVLVSFGGYLAVPLAMAAWLCRVPIVTHEQTRIVGQATKIIGGLARVVAYSFADTNVGSLSAKAQLTGNPLRSSLFVSVDRPAWLSAAAVRRPMVYITGGNQGSQVLNTTTAQAISTLSKHWTVIHQCGNATSTSNYRAELERAKQKLPKTQQDFYQVFEWLPESELAWIYQHVSGVISRAGANTLSELVALHVPAILVPLPFSNQDEQQQNADWLAAQGGAVVLTQKDLNVESLVTALTYIRNHQANFRTALSRIQQPPQAAETLAKLVIQVAG